ncbi:hypothetical protein [Jatrophihabitans lederbergiae]|uniref:Uncharacterized protein n=1 Tax=Jatrophihabitans lederbergiae TaxID=3075547 RepID=A0ABU2JH91_9ACTN|nr:hypothetical protein [Jatrophihabitans sp. DSM 44399]MDT0263603.1 hypothetical protein [Jatrophihabitans sp. DSM 44399]
MVGGETTIGVRTPGELPAPAARQALFSLAMAVLSRLLQKAAGQGRH